MDQPAHSPDTCTQKDGRWECLHAIDADHFWLGDLMVDLVQLRYDELRASRDKRLGDWNLHEIGVSMSTLRNVARRLAKGEPAEAYWATYALKRINKMGMHTGYTEIPDRGER